MKLEFQNVGKNQNWGLVQELECATLDPGIVRLELHVGCTDYLKKLK